MFLHVCLTVHIIQERLVLRYFVETQKRVVVL